MERTLFEFLIIARLKQQMAKGGAGYSTLRMRATSVNVAIGYWVVVVKAKANAHEATAERVYNESYRWADYGHNWKFTANEGSV